MWDITCRRGRGLALVAALIPLSAALLGCEGDSGESSGAVANRPGSGNLPPAISGNPASMATVGTAWSFVPVSSDPEGDALVFSADAAPEWLSIDSSTGTLTGTPSEADIGTWSGIVITVSDGTSATALPAFEVSVVAPSAAGGWARLSWIPPEQREDGSPIGDVSGYSIHYGNGSRQYDRVISIDNPGVTSYLVEGLGAGTWYFSMKTRTSDGLESGYSSEVSKTVSPCDAGDPLASC